MARKRDVAKAIKAEMNDVRYGPPAKPGKASKFPPMKGKKKAC